MRYLLSTLFICLTVGLSAQTVIHVNGANATPGDGSSWATAYANLNDALLAAPSGASVWVAAGTYVTPDSTSFLIDKELTLLGGFAGTETSPDAADPMANVTTLSGDVLGNDPAMGYDSTLFDDNNRVLLVLDSAATSSFTVRIDGLTITHGGNATNRQGGAINAFAGGGILALAKVDITRTTFSFNRSNFGSAIYVEGANSNGSRFDQVSFTNNFSDIQRTFFIQSNQDVVVSNCDFVGTGLGDLRPTGFIWARDTDGILFENCAFSNMYAAARGGGIVTVNSDDFTVRGCSFIDMNSFFGGAAIENFITTDYVTDRERSVEDFVIEGCTFENNLIVNPAGGDIRGGSLKIFNANTTLRDCTFKNVRAPSNGGAIDFETFGGRTETYELIVDNLDFNDIEGGADGGAITLLQFGGTTLNAQVSNTNFKNCRNIGAGLPRGGALYQFAAGNAAGSVSVSNCTFEGCWSELGAVGIQSSVPWDFKNCRFVDNGDPNRSYQGGAIWGLQTSAGGGVTIDSSEFINNLIVDADNFANGGAIFLWGNSAEGVTENFTVTNSRFEGNSATGDASGGAISLLYGWDVLIDNCDFVNNQAAGDGGAINALTFTLGDSTDTYLPEVKGSIINSRFSNNLASNQGGAITTQRIVFDLINNSFINNAVGLDGASGGAVIFNGNSPNFDGSGELSSVGDRKLVARLYHNTFVNNFHGDVEGAVGDHIALFQEGVPADAQIDTNSMEIIMANNAFFNADPTSEAIAFEPGRDIDGFVTPVGDLTITSLGGNYLNQEVDPLITLGDDDTTNTALTGTNDISAIFVDPYDDMDEGFNTDLVIPDNPSDNPLINSAVLGDFVPAFDLRGNPRGEAPDIGAYEADQAAVSTDQPIADSGLEMSFYPNPTTDVLMIQNTDATITDFTVVVADQRGRALASQRFSGSANALNLAALPAGVYNLRLLINGKVYGQQVVKQ